MPEEQENRFGKFGYTVEPWWHTCRYGRKVMLDVTRYESHNAVSITLDGVLRGAKFCPFCGVKLEIPDAAHPG